MTAPGRPIRPMRTTSGGVVDPDELVGRDVELGRLLAAVETGGAKLLGDRRMGKTSLLEKAEQELRAGGHHVVRVSAETDSPVEFGRRLLAVMRTERVLGRAMPEWTAELGGTIGLDVGFASLSLTGSTTTGGGGPGSLDLFRACSEAARRAGPERVVFLLDEVTALGRALNATRPGAADELFRALRVPRQSFGNVSVVVAGSIGLHHVVTDMAVVNDIPPVSVGPLRQPDAMFLTRCLLRGAEIATSAETAVAEVIVERTSGVPFYIHRLVDALDSRGMRHPRPEEVGWLADGILGSPDDPWEMRHYVSRLADYYGDEAGLARAALDVYAGSHAALSVDDVLAQLAAVDLEPRPDRDAVLALVDRLEADHYLVRIGDRDGFATPLLHLTWRALRRLG